MGGNSEALNPKPKAAQHLYWSIADSASKQVPISPSPNDAPTKLPNVFG